MCVFEILMMCAFLVSAKQFITPVNNLEIDIETLRWNNLSAIK